MSEVLVVFCTCPDAGAAERLAAALVDQRLAACVNILPKILSIYRWEGDVQSDAEALMVVKTTREAYPGLERWLEKHHPYDVPEILALPVQAGSGNYLDWVLNETKNNSPV
jgi:periplasmic divalent cation tolerance protein